MIGVRRVLDVSSLKAALPGLLAVGVCAGLAAAASAPHGAKTGEIRVFVLDKSGKVPDLSAATATVTINPKAEKPETLRLTLQKPATAGTTGMLPASAEAKDSGDYRVGVDLYVAKPKEEKGEKAAEGAEKDTKAGKAHAGEPAFPFFKATVPLEEWACAKCKGTPAANPGKCAKCGGELAAQMREFDVAVNVKIGDKDVKVSGIHLKARAMAMPAAGEKPKGY